METPLNPKELTKLEKELHAEALNLFAQGVSAPLFSSKFFGQEGLIRKLWKTDEERKVVVSSKLYKWLQKRLADLRQREVQNFEENVSALSGRLTVVVPKSLHAALKNEAQREGVSLSELIRLKLGIAYQDMVQVLNVGARGTRPAARR